MSYSLTILTPLYNRTEYIERMYESLSAQTRKDFQWLVVDDGSKVSSEEAFAKIAGKAPFAVEYHYKENGGKHTALNFSHPYIKSDYVLILDSDDTLTPDAVETVCRYTEKYKDNNEVGIFSFLRGTDAEHPLANFPKEEQLSDHITFRINENRPGDCCEVVRTDVFREFPFPVFGDERFLSEAHLWINSAKKYKTVYVKKVIYLNDYQPGGLTDAGHNMRRKYPLGGMYTQKLGLDKRFRFSYRAKRAILLLYYGRLAGKKTAEVLEYSEHPAFVRAFYLPARLLYAVKNRGK